MKKFLAMMLAAMLLLSCSAALAETTVEEKVTIESSDYAPFDVTMVIPDEYTKQEYRSDGLLAITVLSDDDDTPDFIIIIAPSEAYEGITLNELSDEEKKELLDTMVEGFNEPEINDLVTEHGTQVYLINEVSPESEGAYYADGFTIYKGYFITVSLYKPNFTQLTQENLDLAIKLLSDMWFVDPA